MAAVSAAAANSYDSTPVTPPQYQPTYTPPASPTATYTPKDVYTQPDRINVFTNGGYAGYLRARKNSPKMMDYFDNSGRYGGWADVQTDGAGKLIFIYDKNHNHIGTVRQY